MKVPNAHALYFLIPPIIAYIVTKNLEMSRVLSRWVPKLLSESQKLERVHVCRQLLRIMEKGN